jgi:hypothetical protein
VQVFDFSTTPAGEPYLVMEYLEGGKISTVGSVGFRSRKWFKSWSTA